MEPVSSLQSDGRTSNADSGKRNRDVAVQKSGRYNDRCLTEAQKEFLTVLARITIRRLIKEVEKELEGETL